MRDVNAPISLCRFRFSKLASDDWNRYLVRADDSKLAAERERERLFPFEWVCFGKIRSNFDHLSPSIFIYMRSVARVD